MIPDNRPDDIDPAWADVVMKILPEMYRLGDVNGDDDSVFVYANTFFAVGAELRRGATAEAIREQTTQVLKYIDQTNRPTHDKEHFAALFARAVDDAIEGRPPCVLH